MTDKQKIEAILNLLTDKNVGLMIEDGAIMQGNESFGAMVFAGATFSKAYKISRGTK